MRFSQRLIRLWRKSA